MDAIEDKSDISSIIELIKNFTYDKKQWGSKIKQEKYTIKEIIDFVDRGEWALPDIQRSFNWNPERIKDLLDSLLRDYFIGTFLILTVNGENNSYFGARSISNTKTDLSNVKGLIFDGQQRITSLYKVIREPDDIQNYFYISLKDLLKYRNSNERDTTYDIVKKFEKKLTDKETYENFYFPFYSMVDYQKWATDLSNHFKENELIEENTALLLTLYIEKVISDFLNKTIPTVELSPDMDLGSLSEIFVRINTKGMELTNFDLMVARLSKYKIKLRDELWKKSRDEIEEHAKNIFNEDFIETKLPLFIAQGLSLYYTNKADRDTILKLYENEYLKNKNVHSNPLEDFKNDWSIFANMLIKAIDRIHDAYYVRQGYVPFTATLPVLIALLKEKDDVKNSSKEELDKKIDMWYWSALLRKAYSKSSESQMSKDITQVKNWFKGGKTPAIVESAQSDWKSNDAMRFLKNDITYKNQDSTFRAILSLIGLNGAKDFITRSSYGERISKNNIDHIFPESIFKKEEYRGHEYVDSILNLTLLSKNTNEYKRDKLPSEYINYFISKYYSGSEENFKEILKTHLINEEAFQAMKDNNFEKFLDARGKSILEAIREKIMPPPSNTQPCNTTQHDITRPNKHNTI